MPIRQGGVLASRASTWPRDHFCRSTMAPRLSRPMTWKEFLPISMPATAIAVLSFEDIAGSLSLAPLASVTAGGAGARPDHSITGLRDAWLRCKNAAYNAHPNPAHARAAAW